MPTRASGLETLAEAVACPRFELTRNQIRLAQSAMATRETHVSDLCQELQISRATLYRYVSPTGELRDRGQTVPGT